MIRIQLLLLLFFCLPSLLLSQPQTRDAKKWPFARTSIWNMPLHKNAIYVPANIQDANSFEADEDIIILTPDAPTLPVKINTAGWSSADRCPPTGPELFSAPIPSTWVFDKKVWHGTTPNAGAAILLPNGKIKQTQPFAKCSMEVATSQYVWSENTCELAGECIAGAHGGSGLSAIGGTIRVGEFQSGHIPHVLKINLWGKENFFGGNGGYRWPANKADGGYDDPAAHNYYGGANPEMRIGALLALHKDLDLSSLKGNSLGLETEAALIIARTLQNYGAYTVDNTAWDSYAFVIENGPDGKVRNEFRQTFGYDMNVSGSLDLSPWSRDLKRIFKSLHVISNNDANNIGGGLTNDFVNRRAPMAPDFASDKNSSQTRLEVSPIGKIYHPDSSRLAAIQPNANGSGSTSVRNESKKSLEWKRQGYFQRNRDLGQVFSVLNDCLLEAIVLRTGPSDKAVLDQTPGAPVFLQLFEVTGTPVIDDNGTPQGTQAKHGFSSNHRCDDWLSGVQYKSLQIIKGGNFPNITPTFSNGKSVNGEEGKMYYMRWKFTGKPITLQKGKRYAFIVGLETSGTGLGFTLANVNTAGVDAPPALADIHDGYVKGWGIRREGDGSLPPSIFPGRKPVAGNRAKKMYKEALFPNGEARYNLKPTTDGYPDVDTYRDLNFAVEVNWK
jgi:hypothetical protein